MRVYKNQSPDIDPKCGSIKIFADLCGPILINKDLCGISVCLIRINLCGSMRINQPLIPHRSGKICIDRHRDQ